MLNYTFRLCSKSCFRQWSRKHSNVLLLSKRNLEKVRRVAKHPSKSDDTVIVEGHRHFIDTLGWGLVPSYVLLTERALHAPLGNDLLKALAIDKNGRSPFTKVYNIPHATLQRICSSEQSQGLLAVFPKLDLTNYSDIVYRESDTESTFAESNKAMQLYQKPSSRLSSFGNKNELDISVLCDHISDPGNMGTLFRNSYGFGVKEMVILGGCNPFSPKVLRSSLCTVLALDMLHTTLSYSTENPSVTMESQIHALLDCGLIRQDSVPTFMFVAVAPPSKNSLPVGTDLGSSPQNPMNYYEIFDFVKNQTVNFSITPCIRLVLGSEANGITRGVQSWLKMKSKCSNRNMHIVYVTIPLATRSKFNGNSENVLESLNVANAAAILLCELNRMKQGVVE